MPAPLQNLSRSAAVHETKPKRRTRDTATILEPISPSMRYDFFMVRKTEQNTRIAIWLGHAFIAAYLRSLSYARWESAKVKWSRRSLLNQPGFYAKYLEGLIVGDFSKLGRCLMGLKKRLALRRERPNTAVILRRFVAETNWLIYLICHSRFFYYCIASLDRSSPRICRRKKTGPATSFQWFDYWSAGEYRFSVWLLHSI